MNISGINNLNIIENSFKFIYKTYSNINKIWMKFTKD
jgi:hypothetical protein